MAINSIGDALFTRTQQKVLGLLFGTPDQSFYTNEIMRRVAMGRGTVSRELDRLTAAGLLINTQSGNQNHYQANPACPIFGELTGIVRKTFGVADKIRQALEPLQKDIALAFIYGSTAKGDDTRSSDIDLMLVGEKLAYTGIVKLLSPLEETLQRSINPSIYERKDFIAKLKSRNSFLVRVMDQPKIMLKGDEDGIGASGESDRNKKAEKGTARPGRVQ